MIVGVGTTRQHLNVVGQSLGNLNWGERLNTLGWFHRDVMSQGGLSRLLELLQFSGQELLFEILVNVLGHWLSLSLYI